MPTAPLGHVVSVCIGARSSLDLGNRTVDTGIGKLAQQGAVHIGSLGLASDVVVDSAHHGGVDQAVYVYLAEHTRWWEQELGRSVPPGLFGENLLLDGLGDVELRVGDRLVLSEVELEISAPRIPCSVLAAKMGDAGFVKRFQRAGRPGVYARVLREGRVREGESVRLVPSPTPTISILELYREWYASPHDPDLLDLALRSPVAERTREKLEEWRQAC